nr:MAG TPA: hypothetical protein [Caudoviricetes sp.]
MVAFLCAFNRHAHTLLGVLFYKQSTKNIDLQAFKIAFKY